MIIFLPYESLIFYLLIPALLAIVDRSYKNSILTLFFYKKKLTEKAINAEKLEVMMRKQGLSNWELVNVVPTGNNALYAIYKKPLN